MKSKITTFALSLATVCMVSSCLKNDYDDVTTYDDTAVTGFTLGALKYYRYKKASDGVTDTCYSKGSVTGSNYAVYIDHYKGYISNDNDSLPVGTDLSKVLVTVSTSNNGIATLNDSTSTSFYSFSSSDSLDFTKPRELRVYSSSGNYYRSYKVNIVAHQEYADSFMWSKVDVVEDLKKYDTSFDFKSIYFNNRIVSFADTQNSRELGTYESGKWQIVKDFSHKASMATDGSTLYVMDDGKLYSTSDFNNWNTIDATNINCIYGICDNEMFALSNDRQLMVSYDKGNTWTADSIDTDSKYLPDANLNFISQTTKTNADIKRAYLIGNNDSLSTKKALVWSKVIEEDGTRDQSWIYQQFNNKNKYYLSYNAPLSVVPYDDGLLALDASSSKLLFSQDCGITWKEMTKFSLPSDLNGQFLLTMAVDKEKFLWITNFYTGEIWKGRLNSEGWAIKE